MIHTYGPDETKEAMSCLGKMAAFSDASKELAYADFVAGRTSILVEIDSHPTNPYVSNAGGRFAFVAADAEEVEQWFVVVTNTEPWPENHPSVKGKMGPFNQAEAEAQAIKIAEIHPGACVYVTRAMSKIMERKSLHVVPL